MSAHHRGRPRSRRRALELEYGIDAFWLWLPATCVLVSRRAGQNLTSPACRWNQTQRTDDAG